MGRQADGGKTKRHPLSPPLPPDLDAFYAACDPSADNLCLYGDPGGGWTVAPPADEVPPELPEPCLGINFAR